MQSIITRHSAIVAIALVVGMAVSPVGLAQAPGDAAATVTKFIDAFNKGDMKGAAATHVTDGASIIDEFPPHMWTGAKALESWSADFDKNAAATGVTDPLVKIGKPTRNVLSGESAYVIVPARYMYKEHGKPMAEDGQMTFALRHGADGWKINAWTWSGPNPHAVVAKKKIP